MLSALCFPAGNSVGLVFFTFNHIASNFTVQQHKSRAKDFKNAVPSDVCSCQIC